MGRTWIYAYNGKTGEYDIDITPDNCLGEYDPETGEWFDPDTGDPLNAEPDAEAAKNDSVNHPSHYTSGKIEVIDFIEDQKLDFHLANALKYICRAGKKDPSKTKEDLEKAVWYLNRYITHVLDE